MAIDKDRELIRAILEHAENPNPPWLLPFEPISVGYEVTARIQDEVHVTLYECTARGTGAESIAVAGFTPSRIIEIGERREVIEEISKRPTCAACGSSRVMVVPNAQGQYLCTNEAMCIERLRVQQRQA